jgi:hypothetical protein
MQSRAGGLLDMSKPIQREPLKIVEIVIDSV